MCRQNPRTLLLCFEDTSLDSDICGRNGEHIDAGAWAGPVGELFLKKLGLFGGWDEDDSKQPSQMAFLVKA